MEDPSRRSASPARARLGGLRAALCLARSLACARCARPVPLRAVPRAPALAGASAGGARALARQQPSKHSDSRSNRPGRRRSSCDVSPDRRHRRTRAAEWSELVVAGAPPIASTHGRPGFEKRGLCCPVGR
ncbi:unnamed protein product [Lota lota]